MNHQNAFPLLWKPRTQDGGGPVTDDDPVVQIERLALWDNKSDKLVQMNHPNLPQILGDRDEDGQPDAGFERMFGFVDVIEVHPPQGIFTPPVKGDDGKLVRNPIFHWMQMLNLGYRNAGRHQHRLALQLSRVGLFPQLSSRARPTTRPRSRRWRWSTCPSGDTWS